MKRFLRAIAIAASQIIMLAAGPVLAADIDLSIRIGHPDFFGRIDIGGLPPPPLLQLRPIVIERVPRGVVLEPLYLRVPPGHARNWRRYCARYEACGRPVYFVKDDWYRNTYAPRYREEHREWRSEERREERRDERREERKDERKDERRDEHRDRHRGDRDDR